MSNPPELILGTAQLGMSYGITNTTNAEFDEACAIDILTEAKRLNITDFDTAPAYGRSENILGSFWKGEANISTKLSWSSEWSSNEIIEHCYSSICQSLKNLQMSKLASVITHSSWAPELENLNVVLQVLKRAKNEGLVEKIGLSVYRPSELKDEYLLEEIDIVQMPSNVFDDRFSKEGCIQRLKKFEVECSVRSIFLQGGLLERKIPNMPATFYANQKLFDEWFKFCEKHEITALEACFNWVRQQEFDSVVVGAASASQLAQQYAAFSNDQKCIRFPTWQSPVPIDLIDPRLW